MLADTILRLLGDDPDAYPNPKDKWPLIFADLSFTLVPIFLVILFISPFLFLWIKKKHFSLKNIIISLFVGVMLVALAIFLLYIGIMLLHAHTVRGIYNY